MIPGKRIRVDELGEDYVRGGEQHQRHPELAPGTARAKIEQRRRYGRKGQRMWHEANRDRKNDKQISQHGHLVESPVEIVARVDASGQATPLTRSQGVACSYRFVGYRLGFSFCLPGGFRLVARFDKLSQQLHSPSRHGPDLRWRRGRGANPEWRPGAELLRRHRIPIGGRPFW